MAIAGNVIVAKGTTVLIPPGARIMVAANAVISVSGTLLASACSSHATLTWPAGASASSGITVGIGGTLTVGGLDIVGRGGRPQRALGRLGEYDDGHDHVGSALPFNVSSGSTLTMQGATVTGTRGTSLVAGVFSATGLDYDSNGNSGIVGSDNGSIDIRNSKLHGNGPFADMLISGGLVGATMNVQNTEIYQVHCAFHFSPVKTFTISYANLHDNAYGFMLYGSGAPGGTMTYSNDVAVPSQYQVGFSIAETNGPIVFDHDYIPDGLTAAGVTITNASPTAIAGAGPM